MSDYHGEKVLVVPRAIFEEIDSFQGFRSDGIDAAMAMLLDPKNHFFMDRAEAEDDPSHKQLIPYCILRHGEEILSYTRGKSGAESRLHAKLSVGIGGHINPIDGKDADSGPELYHAAVARELAEEVSALTPVTNRIIGLINDDSTEVGQVHLGVVHLIDLQSADLQAMEDAIAGLSFHPLEELNSTLYPRLEAWSQFCIRHLAESM